jgi:chitinase
MPILRAFAVSCLTVMLAAALPVQTHSRALKSAPTVAPIVVGYVFPQNAALQPGEIDAQRLTRINYAFANIDNGRMVTGFAKDAENFAYLNDLKRQNPSLVVLVSVGGWLWSTNFSDVSLTQASRQTFIDSVMDFLTRYHLDGLDIDWEYPGMVGSGHPFRPKDKQNFTLLLAELRSRFDSETRKTHHHLYLTIAAGASSEFLEHTEMAKVQQYVDTVNLMAYDYYEPSSDKITGHHAPLYTSPADPKKISSDESVREFEAAGVPSEKLVLGLPFYGHEWGEVNDQSHGLFQPGKPVPNAYANYGAITSTMLTPSSGFTRYWDPVASVPYLYNAQTHTFVTYDDPQSIAIKCQYVLSHRLGGVMFWDYSGDPTGALLGAIDQSFHQPEAKGSSRP